MSRSGHEMTRQDAQNKYDAKMKSFLEPGKGEMHYVDNITRDYEIQGPTGSIKKGTVLFKRHKLHEEIKRFLNFIEKRQKLIGTRNTQKEEHLKRYHAVVGNKYNFENEDQKNEFTRRINESISFDNGKRMQWARLKRMDLINKKDSK